METDLQSDFTVIGGGIVGLWTAYYLKKKYPQSTIFLFEASPYWGHETSTRNSGVLHSGLYYPTGSLKHRLCLRGHQLWQDFASDFHFNYNLVGKYLFSSTSEENQKLHKLSLQAEKNGVKIEWCDEKRLAKLSEHLHLVQAFFIPSTGVLDVPQALYSLSSMVERLGVVALRNHQLQSLEINSKQFQGQVNSDHEHFFFKTDVLINCAGLKAVEIREKLPLEGIKNYFVKGHYLKSAKKLCYSSLYYPTPLDNLKGLGVHSTIDLYGNVKFGPDAIDATNMDYKPEGDFLNGMVGSISRLYKNVDPTSLSFDFCGIRPKITQNGQLITDFLIQKKDYGNCRYIECLGVESPGLTASPAIGEYIINEVLK